MGRKRKTSGRQFWESAVENDIVYRHYFNHLVELSISMFDWKNLPESIDPRFMELTLFTDGQAVFFKDEVMGFLCLQNAMNGQMDIYRIPIMRRAYAVNGYQKVLNESDSVIIFNNYLHYNSMLDAKMFAKKLYEIDRIIDVNIRAQKTPILITCDDSERLTLENIYMQYDGNKPVINGTKGLNATSLQVLKTDAPFISEKLYELKSRIWNEALTCLGISNISINKKERMITDEVARTQGGTVASRYSRLNARQEACKKINEMFGLDIWCEYREDYKEKDEALEYENKDTEIENEERRSLDEQVYD